VTSFVRDVIKFVLNQNFLNDFSARNRNNERDNIKRRITASSILSLLTAVVLTTSLGHFSRDSRVVVRFSWKRVSCFGIVMVT